jgi:hypothetical protein
LEGKEKRGRKEEREEGVGKREKRGMEEGKRSWERDNLK